VTAPATVTGVHEQAARVDYVLQLADTSLVLGQRLGELLGHAPTIEEDLGLANISLDLIGQARLLLTYAGELEGRDRTEDQFAFLRVESEFRNLVLAEQPNGDFAQTIVRQVLIDNYQLSLHERLQHSTDARLAAIATKSLNETRYHWRYSSGWLIRLGDGTRESHLRAQRALDQYWPYTHEFFDERDEDRALALSGVAPALSEVATEWSARIDSVLGEATLQRPAETPYRWFGRRGAHSEHLGYLLADMQYLQRTYPGAQW
jgi:ring-1,2-phenylacetyl-CoA epoxidase subunit PaaC